MCTIDFPIGIVASSFQGVIADASFTRRRRGLPALLQSLVSLSPVPLDRRALTALHTDMISVSEPNNPSLPDQAIFYYSIIGSS